MKERIKMNQIVENKINISRCCNDYDEAAENEHMYCLKNLVRKGYVEKENVCYIAAENNNFEMLKVAVEIGFDVSDEAITATAIVNGNLEMLKYLHENGCPITRHTVKEAAAWGRLDCLKYLHKNGCDWDSAAPLLAAENGNLDCFKYLYENQCPIDLQECLDYATREEKKIIIINYIKNLNSCKTKKNKKKKSCCNDYNEAAENEHMDCLKYLFQKGYDMEEEYVCVIAAEKNNFKMLKFAVENGFDVSDEAATATAIVSGNLEMLKYLHKNGCPITRHTVREAAAWERSDCLKYLHKNGCDWDSAAPLLAAENGNLDCFKYLYENQCPIDLQECLDYATRGKKKIIIINYIKNVLQNLLHSCKTKKK
jgi:hypothetical protein